MEQTAAIKQEPVCLREDEETPALIPIDEMDSCSEGVVKTEDEPGVSTIENPISEIYIKAEPRSSFLMSDSSDKDVPQIPVDKMEPVLERVAKTEHESEWSSIENPIVEIDIKAEPGSAFLMSDSSDDDMLQVQAGVKDEITLEHHDVDADSRTEAPQECDASSTCLIHSQLKSNLFSISGERRHSCSLCGKCFEVRSSLRTHIHTHAEHKKHKCNICGRCFAFLSQLKRHIGTHKGEREYECSLCGKCFTLRGNLNKHLATHTGEREHKCEVCGKCFFQRSTLKSHVLTHTGEKKHKCSVCGMCFARIGHLKRHSLVHTGEKELKCAVCGKCFARRGTLQTHLLTHTQQGEHKCSICGKCFNRRGYLRMHLASHARK